MCLYQLSTFSFDQAALSVSGFTLSHPQGALVVGTNALFFCILLMHLRVVLHMKFVGFHCYQWMT
jgi:hypothetical protein